MRHCNHVYIWGRPNNSFKPKLKIFTLSKKTVSANRDSNFVEQIISGGHAGVDRAALGFAITHGIPHGGYCPSGRRAEDGVIQNRYHLTETESEGYKQRTRRNVEESDATLILNLGPLDGGSLETQRIAEQLGKPVVVVQLDPALEEGDGRLTSMMAWLRDHWISSLNVAGPRESKRPGIYRLAREFLDRLVLSYRFNSHLSGSAIP